MTLANNFTNRVRRFHCGAVEVEIFVVRHMGHYLYNVFMMVFLITSIIAASWAIRPNDIACRLATDLALLLTGQAFKLVIADKLPKVNYLTIVDMYILACFSFIVAGILMHGWVGWQGYADQKLDRVLMVVWGASWGSFNVMYMLV